jgi:actin-related protein
MSQSTKTQIKSLMLESFKVLTVQFVSQDFAAWSTTGKETGVSLTIGNTSTDITIFDSNGPTCYNVSFPNGINHTFVFGSMILKAWSVSDIKRLNRLFLEELKNTFSSLKRSEDDDLGIDYYLPNGKSFNMGQERSLSAEIFFNPSVWKIKKHSIQRVIIETIFNHTKNEKLMLELFNNIHIFGGVANLPGLDDKIKYEINKVLPNVETSVTIDKNPHLSAWNGGKILSSVHHFV